MVKGIETFKEKFKGLEDCYTIVGGTACDILMTDADASFRATKDIDLILIFEDRYKEFACAFWEYIKEGGYRCGWKNSEDAHFYRFTEPGDGYPKQIELFSRKPDYHLDTDSGIVPIHIDDDISSLSAILLNDDFYNFMLEGRKTVLGVSVLDASHLIPFKMFAWLNLKEKEAQGGHVNEKDLKKHKYDVFRLLEIVPNETVIPVFGMVKESVNRFLARMQEEPLTLDKIGVSLEKQRALELLDTIYRNK